MQASLNSYTEKTFYAQRFALWLAIGSMVMMFAGFTSAYIVKKGDVINWINFDIPIQFYISTGFILISSLFMHLAYRAFKKEKLAQYKTLLLLTIITGLGFVVSQIIGWNALMKHGLYLTHPDHVSAAFLYVITGAHAVHVIGGVFILLISYFKINKKLKDPLYDLTMAISPRRKFKVELVTTYWHFVDILWIYLFVFLLYNHI